MFSSQGHTNTKATHELGPCFFLPELSPAEYRAPTKQKERNKHVDELYMQDFEGFKSTFL